MLRITNGLLLTLLCASFCISNIFAQQQSGSKLPAFVYGTWVTTRHTTVGSHAIETPERAGLEVGKTVTFGKGKFAHDKNFLFFEESCSNTGFLTETTGQDPGGKGALWFYRLEEAPLDKVHNIIVTCSGEKSYSFEITMDRQLAVYYDGWFFFLKRHR